MPAHGDRDWQRIKSDPSALARAESKAHGYVAWSVDPVLATLAGTQANTHLVSVFLTEGEVIQGIMVPVTVAGATMTLAQVGIYDINLNLVASSPNNAAAFQSTGWIKTDLSAPYKVPATGLYYMASGFSGTTLPTVLNVSQNSNMSANLPSGFAPRGVHAQVPSGALPNPAVSQGSFTNVPLLIAY